MVSSYRTEFDRYRTIAEKALGQVSDDDLNCVPVDDGNSMAMLVRHLSGNLTSRFTDFLTSDGEKPWRNRDAEFEERAYTRSDVNSMWESAWAILNGALDELTDQDLSRTVLIRGNEWTVDAALARSVSHLAYHVGQMVLLARIARQRNWDWISIPKGHSNDYNRDPDRERGFGTQ